MFVLFEIENKNKNMSHVQTKKNEEQQGEQSLAGSQSRWAEGVGEKEKKGKKKLLKKCWLLSWNTPVNILWTFFFLKTKSIFPFKKKLAPRHFMKTQ